MDFTNICGIPLPKGKHLIQITDTRWKSITGKDIPEDAIPLEHEGWDEIEIEVK